MSYFWKTLMVLGLGLSVCHSYETDQYSFMNRDLKDSTEVLDELVNRGIDQIARSWSGERDDKEFAMRVARLFSSRQLERFVNTSELIESVNEKENSVYRTVSIGQSPIIRMKGMASTFKLNGVLIGADKMSHFFGVGGILYRIVDKGLAKKNLEESVQKALKHSVFTEKAYWGELTTNVFSNADLVVNYEGYIALKSLNEDNAVAGKKAIIRWHGNTPIVRRKFTFRDHVNDFWSEALNPNWYQWLTGIRVRNVLRTYCVSDLYQSNPAAFVSIDEGQLRKKYSFLMFKKNSERFRLDHICSEFFGRSEEKRERFLARQKELEDRMRPKMLDFNRHDDTASSAEELVEAGGLPTCGKKLEKAWEEHRLFMEYFRTFFSPLKAELLRLSEFSRRKEFLLASLSGVSLFKEGDWIVAAGSWKNTSNKLRARFQGDKICIEGEMDLSQYPNNRAPSLSANVCLEGEKETTYYYVQLGKIKRYSLENFQGLEDAKSYIYRTVPMLCRWY